MVSMAGLSWILLSLGQVICFTSLSQIFVLTYSSSLAIARLHSFVKPACTRCASHRGSSSLSIKIKRTITDVIVLFMVSMAGLEPARETHTPLKRARIPIPPHRQAIYYLIVISLTFECRCAGC